MKKKDVVLSLLSGALLVLSFPNFNLEFLAWFALVPLFYSLEEKNLLSSFFLGYLAGFISFLGILYWIVVAVHTYGNIALLPSILILLLLILYLSLFFGTFTLLVHLVRQRFGSRMLIVAPFLWVALEYLRSFLMTGFPWAYLGHSQYLNLPLIQVADITGVYGLSFIVLWVNVTLYLTLHQWPARKFPYREALISAAILIAVLCYGYVKMGATDRQNAKNPALRIGLVQGSIDQSVKWNEAFQKVTLETYERLSLSAAKGKPELIIWPETATPFFFQDEKRYQPFVLNVPVQTNAFLLFGSPSYKVERGKLVHYNSAYLAAPSGELTGRYDKIHLVPFGEYVPLGDILSLGSLGEGIGDFRSGKEVVNLVLPRARFGVLICFEIIFPDLCRQFVKKGANFLVTITNDAWFGRTSAPYQHFSLAVFRAVENRVYVARAANTGISGIIDPGGRIRKQGGIFKEEAINGVIHLSTSKTFYTLHGDVFAWICSGVTLLLVGCIFLRRLFPRE
jgi:apolipoprotein N-acyltransferase